MPERIAAMVIVNVKDEIEVLPKRIDAVAITVKDEIEDDMSESESESEFEPESESESEDDMSESEDESESESESEDDLSESGDEYEYESESADENDESDSLSDESLAATARELDINPEEYPRETLVAVSRGRGSIIPEQYPYLLPGSKPVPPGWIVAHKGYRAIPGDWTALPPTTGRGARAADAAVPRYVVPVPNVDDVPRAPAPKSIPPGWKSLPPGWKVLPLGWGMAYREFEVAPPTWRLIPIEYRVVPPSRAPQ